MTETLKDLAAKVKIVAEYGKARLSYEKRTQWQQESQDYLVALSYQKRRMSVDFWMGQAHTAEPDAKSVLDCLLSDALAGDDTFEDFCAEFGYGADSRSAERTYQACVKTGERLRKLLGDDFDRFMSSERG